MRARPDICTVYIGLCAPVFEFGEYVYLYGDEKIPAIFASFLFAISGKTSFHQRAARGGLQLYDPRNSATNYRREPLKLHTYRHIYT